MEIFGHKHAKFANETVKSVGLDNSGVLVEAKTNNYTVIFFPEAEPAMMVRHKRFLVKNEDVAEYDADGKLTGLALGELSLTRNGFLKIVDSEGKFTNSECMAEVDSKHITEVGKKVWAFYEKLGPDLMSLRNSHGVDGNLDAIREKLAEEKKTAAKYGGDSRNTD